jgi:hypothetical protein
MQLILRADDKITDICPWTPLHCTDLALESPPLHFTPDIDLPQAYYTIVIATDYPGTLRAYTNAPNPRVCVRILQRTVIWEGTQAAGARQFGNETIGVNVKSGPLYSWCKIEVELTIKPLLDELIISWY